MSSSWVFVDDMLEPAAAIKDQLEQASQGAISVIPVGPAEARELLYSKGAAPAGVLMDIDFSSTAGEVGSGAGIAQELRLKQMAGEISEFPIIRFAAAGPIRKYVSGDSSSEDLFDFLVPKERFVNDPKSVCDAMMGAEDIYRSISDSLAGSVQDRALVALGVSPEQAEDWGHPDLFSRFNAALKSGVHVAAGFLIRYVLAVAGVLVDERTLAVRLGVDFEEGSDDWPLVLDSLEGIRYSGIGSKSFSRWWAAGVDEWWLEKVASRTVLLSLRVDERNALLREAGFDQLKPLLMPKGSLGDRPWNLCQVASLRDVAEWVPVDPRMAVRLQTMATLPVWVDDSYCSFGEALRREREDSRLSRVDLERLRAATT